MKHRVPVSVLLPGTGALLLAALMIGSAVLWGVLAPVVQASLLIALVAAVGAAVAWLMRRLPATGNVLAVLTAAAGVVVGSALPRIIDGLDSSWYPAAAAAAGAAASLVAGRALGVRLWWHTGLAAAAVSAALVIGAVMLWSDLLPWGLGWSVCLLLITLPVATASLLVSRAESARDPDTARTTAWIGAAGMGVVLAALLAAGRSWLGQLADASLLPADRMVLVAAVLGGALVLWRLARREFAPDLLGLIGSGLLGVAAMVLVIPVPPFSVPARVVAAAVPVAVLGVLASRPGTRSAAVAAGMGSAALLGMTAVGKFDVSWQILLVWGLGSAVIAAGLGLATTSSAWLVPAAGVMAAAWAATWSAGHLGAAAESLVLPVAAFLPALWSAGCWRGVGCGGWADARVGQLLVLASVAPSVVVAWRDQMSGQWVLWRVLLVVGVGAIRVDGSGGRGGRGRTRAHLGRRERMAGGACRGLQRAPGDFGAADRGRRGARRVGESASGCRVVARGGGCAVGGLADDTPRMGYRGCAADAVDFGGGRADRRDVAATGRRLADRRHRDGPAVVGVPGKVGWAVRSAGGGPDRPERRGRGGVRRSGSTCGQRLVAGAGGAACRYLGAGDPVVGVGCGGGVADDPGAAVAADLGAGRAGLGGRARRPLGAHRIAGLGGAGGRRGLAAGRAGGGGQRLGPRRLHGPVGCRGDPGGRLAAAPGDGCGMVAHRPLAIVGRADRLLAVVGDRGDPAVRRLVELGADRCCRGGLDRGGLPRLLLGGGRVRMRRRLVAAVYTIPLLHGPADQAIEMVTWPAAAALGIMAWLLWRAVGQRGPSLLWVGPPVGLALLPTAATALADGAAGWRAWFGLLVGAAVLVVVVRVEWAGLVLPGLLAVILVAAPVLLQAAVDLPLWIPLTIDGGLLIAIGARLEATRREGHRLIDWAVHLH